MSILTLPILLASAFSSPSMAAEPVGIDVVIEVRDAADNAIIPTAVIRHPQEAQRHPVNVETGQWKENVLYMADGTEMLFNKGDLLDFEVSAPGYKNYETSFVVRKRKNLHIVLLEKMKLTLDEEYENEPDIGFIRDIPLDK